MSTIAQLLIEQSRNAAAARAASGAIWGNAIQNVSQIPGQVMAAQQQKQDRDRTAALAASRDARETSAAADESKLRNLQITGVQQGQAQQSALDAIWGSGIIKEDGTIDKEKAQQLAQRAGMPHLVPAIIDQANKWDASAADLNAKKTAAQKSTLELQAAQRDQLGTDAADLKAANADPGTFSLWVAKRAKDGVIPPEVANSAITAAHQDPTTVGPFLDRLIQGSKTAQAQRMSGIKDVPEGGTLADLNTIDPTTGKPRVLVSGEPKPKPLDQQLLEANIAGDTVKATAIKNTLLQDAQAKKDPAAAAMARELAGLNKDLATQRLKDLQEKNKRLDITPDVQTTRSGKAYLDGSLYSAGERDRAREAAGQAGATFVSKEQANALQEIDNARANQASIITQIKDLLPKGPGDRLGASVAVPLEKLFQTNDQVGAFNSWRTAAIQTLRATAGSKGLRINQAEIAQAIENDIPKLTDTVGVAQQKMKNINMLLDNAEGSIVTRNRGAAAGPQTIRARDANGVLHEAAAGTPLPPGWTLEK